MALKSWDGLYEMAAKAAVHRSAGKYSKAFFRALEKALKSEAKKRRKAGDKHGLSDCIKAGMRAASSVLIEKHPDIITTSFGIEIPGLSIKKWPDYAFRHEKRIFLIEQKSILRFNEFSQVFYEALLAKEHTKDLKVRFFGLFNYFHQDLGAFDSLCHFDKRPIVDGIVVLIPKREYVEYDIAKIDGLFGEIEGFLFPKKAKRSGPRA